MVPDFVDKMHDIISLYLRPPDHAVVHLPKREDTNPGIEEEPTDAAVGPGLCERCDP